MEEITKKDLLTANYDIVLTQDKKIGAFNSFYGITDENKYDFNLDEAGEYASKDTLTLFEMTDDNIIINFSIIDFYGDVIDRELFLRAERFLGKKFVNI
jgi:hypothetical protein